MMTPEEFRLLQAQAVTRRQFFGGVGVGLGSIALTSLLEHDGYAQGKSTPDAQHLPVGPLAPKAPMIPAKAKAVAEVAAERGIELPECAAYSDSINDLPLLESVGFPHAVNPESELKRLALVRGIVVGLMYMEDEKGLDSKVVLSLRGAGGRPLHELTPSDDLRIADYFRRYKEHEIGAYSKVPGWGSVAEGISLVERTHAFFLNCRERSGQACRVAQ